MSDKKKKSKSILHDEVIKEEKAIVPPLNEDVLVQLPTGQIKIDIPEFHQFTKEEEEEEERNEEKRKNEQSEDSSENTDDEGYFKLHAEMESGERLRFIRIVQSSASKQKKNMETLDLKYYTMTTPDELICTYKKMAPLVVPQNYLDRYSYDHCTHHNLQNSTEKLIFPPKPPQLKGEWEMIKKKPFIITVEKK